MNILYNLSIYLSIFLSIYLSMCIYIYTVYIYIHCIYIVYIYTVYVYSVCMYIYIYTYSVYIYIYIYIYSTVYVYIYIYVVSGPSGGLHFHMFRGIFYFHIYIYTVCIYIYILYIYMCIYYICIYYISRFPAGLPQSRKFLWSAQKCPETASTARVNSVVSRSFRGFNVGEIIYLYIIIYITLSCNLKWKPKTKLWKVVIIFLKKRPVHSENNLI